jgi:hypothetical protein
MRAKPHRGFDAFVGNPPFAGKNTITAQHGDVYLDWLKTEHNGAHGNSDLVAHFFRRTFVHLRSGGTLGLIATNTIAQGDTRATGLRWILQHEGVIYDAVRRYKWPGLAAVIVSVLHIQKQPQRRHADGLRLDGKLVERISAFLFHTGGDDDPAILAANASKSFQGSIVLGMGFTFDDTSESATAISEMHRLIAKNPRNKECIFPYLGGDELNSSPTHDHHRYVINFGQMTESEARRWPDLVAIVETKVRGTRGKHSTAEWWHFERLRPELYAAIRPLGRVPVVARTTKHLGFALTSANRVFSENIVVFALPARAFPILQCRIHDLWVRFTSSTLEDRQGYRPTDCFETFPFPLGWESSHALDAAGAAYDAFRAELMIRNGEGLTITYNRFHDPDERDADVLKLRMLHAALDRQVLDAYGWSDLTPSCEFLLDYDERHRDEEEILNVTRKKKRPWRLRWHDEVRDEVLARLHALNAERAAEEKRLGLTAAKPGAPAVETGKRDIARRARNVKARKANTGNDGPGGLFK